MRWFLILSFILCANLVFAQYTMSNQTVSDCNGTLTDSEANPFTAGWYTHNENFSFTICPVGVTSIIVSFSFFETEPQNDYVMIYDGPNNTFPLIGGPYSGVNLPPQVVSSGCITIDFISDINVAAEGFELSWESEVSVPLPPILSIVPSPTCSTNTIILNLDQNIHCDSVYTASIDVSGQINQNINATPLNCINDSTNTIQLDLSPGLNESGIYNISLQSYFIDACDSIWDLSANTQLVINDCPLQLNINPSPDSIICQGDCVDLYVNVNGGDSTSYSYSWTPTFPNSPGPHNVCPLINTVYSVTVSDASPAVDQTENILITVLPPPVTQSNFSICETDPQLDLSASPTGGSWSGPGIINSNNGTFSPNGLSPGVYTITYESGGCSDEIDITVIEINAGPDISVCVNTPTFNLNTSSTTIGGTWSGCNCIQLNGEITVGGIPTTITAIYTLPNGCSDTLLVSVVNDITMPAGTTLCQQSGNYPLLFSPSNGVWSVLPDNPQLVSSCLNSIILFPHQEGWENSLNGWTHDPANDFDWMINSGATPSGNTGPTSAYEGIDYIYTEASNPNFPAKSAAIISPCINLSEYNNPLLYFWYHKYGVGQGTFAIDISIDNGATWILNHWDISGDLGNQWNEAVIDLSPYNTSEVLIRLRVVTGNDYSSDVAVDKLSILAGPVTPDGTFLTDLAISGIHNLQYSIEGCHDLVDIIVNEIDAGPDQIACPSQSPFNLIGSPVGGIWSGNNITNTNLGTFDPSISLGSDVIVYSYNGCVDTAEAWVLDTDVQIDSLFFCINSGLQTLDVSMVPRIPMNGIWSGTGIVPANPELFNPALAGVGVHNIIYSANTCSDNLIVKIFPNSILSDTLICSSSPDIVLDVSPLGGSWIGNGIMNNAGLFSPSQIGIGSHYVMYMAPNSCVDTFIINVYDSPELSMSGLEPNYCFIDSNIFISITPSSGGVLSGNGIVGNSFNPALAGEGYHIITFTYGAGNCMQVIDTVVFVQDELSINTYINNDSLCLGDFVTIGVNASGGTGSYSFSWNNGLSNSFEHLINPSLSTFYVVSVSDACSDNSVDSIPVFVYPSFSALVTTSEKKCYGELGYAKLDVLPNSSYTYKWDINPINYTDSIVDLVNQEYEVVITDIYTNCTLSETVTIPGYDQLKALFFANKNECISLLDGEFQFLDNSIVNPLELSNGSFWDFGDSITTEYVFAQNPLHNYNDTGVFTIALNLVNEGGCTDSFSIDVCVYPENKLYVPNSFTPNSDQCNDEFFVKGIGDFHSFNIKIYKRWGGDILFESDEIILTDNYSDGNVCSVQQELHEYYKMGSWNGDIENGIEAFSGVYGYVVEYKRLEDSDIETLAGTVMLIR